MWRMSGIHRHVTITSKPASAHITDFAVRTPLIFGTGADAGKLLSARLEVDVKLEGSSQELLGGLRLQAHVLGEGGKVVCPPLDCDMKQVSLSRLFGQHYHLLVVARSV